MSLLLQYNLAKSLQQEKELLQQAKKTFVEARACIEEDYLRLDETGELRGTDKYDINETIKKINDMIKLIEK